MRRLADTAMALLARVLVRVFFRQVELGGEALPDGVPIVLVANHLNGLVDGLLLIATLRRYPRFLGKSTLFKIAPLWPFLKLAGVIPVYRAIDGAAGDQNTSAFSASRDILSRRGLVALFPEGISHNEPSLQPLKTGAARIALEAGIDGGVDNVVVVAVGLTYDNKARFRSRALVRVAAPVGIDTWADAYRRDSHEVVRQFTEDVAAQLVEVSPTFVSWAHAERLTAMADVLVRTPGAPTLEEVSLSDRTEVVDRLAEATDLQSMSDCFNVYDRELRLLGLTDAQVVANYSRGRLRLSLLWSLLKVLGALPFAVVGVAAHVVPFQLVKQVAKKPPNEGIKATVKLLGCFAAFVLVYAIAGYFVGRAEGVVAGLVVSLALPVCGYVTVRLGERIKRIGGLLEGYRTVSNRRAVLTSVVAHRRAFVDAARLCL